MIDLKFNCPFKIGSFKAKAKIINNETQKEYIMEIDKFDKFKQNVVKFKLGKVLENSNNYTFQFFLDDNLGYSGIYFKELDWAF